MRNNHEIDYKIYGEELQFVEVELDPQETVIGEPGGFMMMEDGIEMQTIFGDGSQQHNSSMLDRLMNAGKRVLVGENLFMTAFTNVGQGKKKVSFAAPVYRENYLPGSAETGWIDHRAKRCISLRRQRSKHWHRFSTQIGYRRFRR